MPTGVHFHEKWNQSNTKRQTSLTARLVTTTDRMMFCRRQHFAKCLWRFFQSPDNVVALPIPSDSFSSLLFALPFPHHSPSLFSPFHSPSSLPFPSVLRPFAPVLLPLNFHPPILTPYSLSSWISCNDAKQT